MKPYQRDFIDLAISVGALRFGEFTLKSGRVSPYFFNAGEFKTGAATASLGKCYAQAIIDSNHTFDMIFGPAYKGIPLATTIASSLFQDHQKDYPFCFNRKEAKDHGEGGVIVGAALSGDVLLVDDVISAGTSVRESAELISQSGAVLKLVAIALDREERGQGNSSAVQEVRKDFGIEVISIISLNELVTYLMESDQSLKAFLPKVEEYREEFGISSQ